MISKSIGQFSQVNSLTFGLALLMTAGAAADESPLQPYQPSLAQVNSVNQLRDVSPNDWSFQALKNLVEDYGCIEGYPDRTYRGNRALTRDEFAAGLNSCLEALENRLSQKGNTVIQPAPQGNEPVGISTNDMIRRAFFNDTGNFFGLTNLSGQANLIFGWRNWENSFMDRMIANDGELVGTIYQDAMNQQMDHTLIRTRDLPNPFNTSVLQNPSYIRIPSAGQPTREIRF